MTFVSDFPDDVIDNAPFWTDRFEAHHLIPSHLADDPLFKGMFEELEAMGLYSHNDFDKNGFYLPRNVDDAKASGRALHNGSHLNGYNSYVTVILEGIRREHLDFFDGSAPERMPDRVNNAAYRSALQAAAADVDKLQMHLRGGLIWQLPDGANGGQQKFDPDRDLRPQVILQKAADPKVNQVSGPFGANILQESGSELVFAENMMM